MAVVTILAGAMLVVTAPLFGRPWIGVLVAGIATLLFGAANLAAALYVRYELTAFELIVRRGVLRTRIPLECIEGVLPVFHEPDAPRPPHVTVVYQRDGRPGAAVLTPADPDRFLRDLADGAPFLERIGDRLLRKPGMIAVS